jgi:DNA repair exonuclease SbcCD ATPase subunit
LREEYAELSQASQTREAGLSGEVARLQGALANEQKARGAEGATAAHRIDVLESTLSATVNERDLAGERGDELASEVGELKKALGTREAELSTLRAQGAESEGRVTSLEERVAALTEAHGRKESLLQKDLGHRSQELADERRKREQLFSESRRAAEVSARELLTRADQLKALELTLTADRQRSEAAGKDSATLLAALHAEADQMRAALAGRTAEASELSEKVDEIFAEKENLRRELTAAISQKDAKVNELSAGLSTERGERRREADEWSARVTREQGRARELEKALEAARADKAKALAEANEKVAARGRRSQEIEQALESAVGAKARLERDAGAKVVQLEARAAEAVQRMQAALRERKDVEVKHARELEELSARHKSDLERREQQRLVEIQKLQGSVQEKSKALKVAELELARIKAKAGPAAARASAAAASAARPSAVAAAPKSPAPAAPAARGEGSSDGTRVMAVPEKAADGGKEVADDWSDVIDKLDKLEG